MDFKALVDILASLAAIVAVVSVLVGCTAVLGSP